MNSNFKVIDVVIRIAVLSLIGLWCFNILSPFIGVVLWGIILAIAFYPIFQWLKSRLGGRANLAAVLITLVAIAIILGPVGLMAKALAENAGELAKNITEGNLVVPPPPENLADLPLIGEQLHRIWKIASTNLKEALKILEPQLQKLATGLLGIAANVGLAVLQFIFSIIISAALILKAKTLNHKLVRVVSRLTPSKGENFVQLASSTLRNVVRGVIGIAAVQTLLIGIGMIAVGIPFAGLLVVLCLVLTIIQIGPGLIVLGSLIYAWTQMSTIVALLYTIWMIPATLVDNILKPILMARGLPVPMLVIFIGVFGGTLAYGIIGLFTGPVILAFGYELLRAWINEDQDATPMPALVETKDDPLRD